MLDTAYQKLMILGFSEAVIIISLCIIGFFILMLIVEPIILFLIAYRCETLITAIVSFLLIFIIAEELVGKYFHFDDRFYWYFFTLATSLLTIRLIYKKIIQKS